MSDLGVFVLAALLATWLWGRVLRYFDERSGVLRQWIFFAMNYTRLQTHEVRSLLLTGIYVATGLVLSAAFATGYRLNLASFFSLSLPQLLLSLLGVVGAISLCNLLVDVTSKMTRQATPERFAELQDIPWIRGLRQLPPRTVPWIAAMAGISEELLFRGVLLRILTDKLGVGPFVAVTMAGAFFTLGQAMQLQTRFQMLVIGSSCVALSLVGGVLVMLTSSFVPALICHGSFVVFFMQFGSQSPGANRTRYAEAVR